MDAISRTACLWCKNEDTHVEVRNWTMEWRTIRFVESVKILLSTGKWKYRQKVRAPKTIPETKFRCCPHCKDSEGNAGPFETLK